MDIKTASTSGFDLEVVLKGFQNCKQKDGDINLQEYVNAFTELARFFRLLGPIFGFVSSDLEEKLHTLGKHQKSKVGQHYKTVASTISYEVSVNRAKVTVSGLRSACRCLLRLNRALEFVLEFMERIRNSGPEAKVATLAAEVYKDTLSKHHVWIVRKMAAVAMYTLPHRHVLIETLCKHSEEEALGLVGEVVAAARPVYTEIQSLLEANNLTDIP